jgi:hypothetical protein
LEAGPCQASIAPTMCGRPRRTRQRAERSIDHSPRNLALPFVARSYRVTGVVNSRGDPGETQMAVGDREVLVGFVVLAGRPAI